MPCVKGSHLSQKAVTPPSHGSHEAWTFRASRILFMALFSPWTKSTNVSAGQSFSLQPFAGHDFARVVQQPRKNLTRLLLEPAAMRVECFWHRQIFPDERESATPSNWRTGATGDK